MTTVARAKREISQEQIVFAVGGLLVVVFAVLVPGFLSVQNMLTIARSVSPLGVLALAMAIVVIARGLDLSLVAVMGVATALALQTMQNGSTTRGILVGLAVVLAVGALNGVLVAFVEMPPLFTTLATGLFVYGISRVIWLGSLVTDLPPDAGLVRFLGSGLIGPVPVPVAAFALLALAVHLLLTRTSLGRFVYAHGDNEEAAKLTGLGVRGLTVAEYTMCSVIGLVAGFMIAGTAGNLNIQIVTSSSLIYEVLAVVVIGGISLVGGRGGVPSVIAGTILIGVLVNGMILLDLNRNVQTIVTGLVLLGAIVLDRQLHPRDEETARQGD
jgi:ribose transport system permease protein